MTLKWHFLKERELVGILEARWLAYLSQTVLRTRDSKSQNEQAVAAQYIAPIYVILEGSGFGKECMGIYGRDHHWRAMQGTKHEKWLGLRRLQITKHYGFCWTVTRCWRKYLPKLHVKTHLAWIWLGLMSNVYNPRRWAYSQAKKMLNKFPVILSKKKFGSLKNVMQNQALTLGWCSYKRQKIK